MKRLKSNVCCLISQFFSSYFQNCVYVLGYMVCGNVAAHAHCFVDKNIKDVCVRLVSAESVVSYDFLSAPQSQCRGEYERDLAVSLETMCNV